MSDLILFWHRRDLRFSDNVGLGAACQLSSKVVGVFCLDPNILQRDDVAPARVTYMIGCLEQLQERYQQRGSQLLILQGDPQDALPALALGLSAKAVYWNLDVEPYGQQRDRALSQALKASGVEVATFWDQLLHPPGKILTNAGDSYKVYTPFWRNWKDRPKDPPIETYKGTLTELTESEQETAQSQGVKPLPSAQDLGFNWQQDLFLEPGEMAAQEKLKEFCDRALEDYDEQRNFPEVDGTSQLSAALKFGAIGIRTVWAKAAAVFEQSCSDEARNNIQTWQQELAWREFYQHAMYAFPKLAEGPYRDDFRDFPWENNPEHFQAWCEGKTGYPIVDAAMRQLNQISWMHNRCRMIVASFLTKDLIINWQWGEKYFMQHLIDGDLSSNNGGWQWSASSGMDPKPLRIFNPASQAQKYDPDAAYIREWLPELRSLETEVLVTGKITSEDRQSCNYPEPVVDHKVQQHQFKSLYKQQKD
ncbi:MAG: deoxyribodipyrimidine photolyase [Oscillatoriales cyanobacterium RM2_1_1]|nr:deoxyribodipyrimidine photolyase [Oscillatoriales cyanobacterium SM2_3_0]NJO47449.1 deoxyribodipyrimidine photolyase [Oscillatoriales cyanobacterium RM2_1_1]